MSESAAAAPVAEEATTTPTTTPPVASPELTTIIEGWGAKQGTKYPNWNIRWFLLQKKVVPADSDEIADTRDYFVHSSDSYERAHNFNVKADKVNLILTYFTDDTKAEVKEVFEFNEETAWCVQDPRITRPKFMGGPIQAIYLFCKGSKGSNKLVFVPFWGFVEPTFKMMCQPWILCMEHAVPEAYSGENDTYFADLAKVDEDTYGRTTKDLEAKLAQFKGCFEDDITFKPYKENVMQALKLFAPIALFGKNGQDDNTKADTDDANAAREKQLDWSMRFNKKLKELNAQKEAIGDRQAWLKIVAQARHRGMRYEAWMQIRDADNNMANLPAHLR